MKEKIATRMGSELLQTAGITINGNQPWDIQIHNKNIYNRVLENGPLGLGESYMDGWWDCAALDQFFYRILNANLEKQIKQNKWFLFKLIFSKLINLQTKKRALEVGKKHYDLGNLLFTNMLDKKMNYTCGYWKNAADLDAAQIAKLDLVCRKLMLKPGMRLLDVGCGWGAMAKFAAENYGVTVVGVTISKQQLNYARQNCAGLPVEIRFQDYRDVQEKFDRIVSLGMFEHVGSLNYRAYLEMIHRSLAHDGLFLLHTIGSNITYFRTNAWTHKYIFPNGVLPSITQVGKNCENLFVMEDWHNFGMDYDKTLLAWHQNFNLNWETKLNSHYDERFYRMWNYYLLSSAAGFRARELQLWQIVFSKMGFKNRYESIR
jgi:cyclopropane-fatty-acyl-phospholipid synthase